MVGRKETVEVYEPFFPAIYRERETELDQFDRGVQKFEAGNFEESIALFTPISSTDPTADIYLKRAVHHMNTVPDVFDGIWHLDTK